MVSRLWRKPHTASIAAFGCDDSATHEQAVQAAPVASPLSVYALVTAGSAGLDAESSAAARGSAGAALSTWKAQPGATSTESSKNSGDWCRCDIVLCNENGHALKEFHSGTKRI